MLATILAALVAAIICMFLAYFKWCLHYWDRKGLNNFPGKIPFGTVKNPSKNYPGLVTKQIYHEMRAKGWRHGGFYILNTPMYLPLDLEYVKNVLTNKFHHFSERSFYYNEKDDPISAHLFAIGGLKWRNLRAKLSPCFTSGKMKTMFPGVVECLRPLLRTVEEHSESNTPIDAREVTECFTTDILGNCAFGLECNAFSDANSPFRVHGKTFFKPSKLQQFKLALASSHKELARFLKIATNEKSTSEFFYDVVRKTIDYREKNNFHRPDFMELLMGMRAKNGEEYYHDGTTLTFDEIVAQSLIFFLGGLETSASFTSFALYEMAANPQVQDKVRDEIKRVVDKNDGQITYETLHELKYLEQVMKETLRKYPAVSYITRECVKDYKVPDENLVIEKGTRVAISIIGIHYDPEYYPHPEKFDPERFSNENKENKNQYAYIPFGGGPRLCIGQKFAILQAKIGLASLLKAYKFTVNENTEQPIQFDSMALILTARSPIWLNVHKI